MNYSTQIKELTIKERIDRLKKLALDTQFENLIEHIEYNLKDYYTDFSDAASWYRINRRRINNDEQKGFVEAIKVDEQRAKEFLYSKGYLLKYHTDGGYELHIREDVDPFSIIYKLKKMIDDKLIANLYKNPKTILYLGVGDNINYITNYIEEQGLSCAIFGNRGMCEVKYE